MSTRSAEERTPTEPEHENQKTGHTETAYPETGNHGSGGHDENDEMEARWT